MDLLGEQRARVVRHLKDVGDATVPELSEVLGLSEVATRRHVDRLAEEALVVAERVNTGRGRPVNRWSLTDAGQRLFPHTYDQVARELLAFLTRDGRGELGEFLRWRQDRQVARLGDAVTADDLPTRVRQLADALSDAGYRAEVDDHGDGVVLRQTHCTIADVAAEEPLLCAHEAAAFGRVLGDDVRVTRRETIATGDAACVCHVSPRRPIEGALPVLPVDSPTTSCAAPRGAHPATDAAPSVADTTTKPNQTHDEDPR